MILQLPQNNESTSVTLFWGSQPTRIWFVFISSKFHSGLREILISINIIMYFLLWLIDYNWQKWWKTNGKFKPAHVCPMSHVYLKLFTRTEHRNLIFESHSYNFTCTKNLNHIGLHIFVWVCAWIWICPFTILSYTIANINYTGGQTNILNIELFCCFNYFFLN